MKDKKNTEGFDLPKDYFQDFEERLFSKISEDKLPKETGFKVPEGYFTSVEEQIIGKVKTSEASSKVISIVTRKTILYAASIAACAILIFSLIPSEKNIITIDNIEFYSIETYIEEGNITINTSDLTAMITDDDVAVINSEIESFSGEFLEEYLVEHIDDSSILIE